MRLSIATKVFLGFVAVLVCSAVVSAYGVARLHGIGQGLSLLSRPYMPLTRAVSNLEAFQKERERSTDRLIDEPDARVRANLIALDRTYFSPVAGERPPPPSRAGAASGSPSPSSWSRTRNRAPPTATRSTGSPRGSPPSPPASRTR